jgi:hypothetical protein
MPMFEATLASQTARKLGIASGVQAETFVRPPIGCAASGIEDGVAIGCRDAGIGRGVRQSIL